MKIIFILGGYSQFALSFHDYIIQNNLGYKIIGFGQKDISLIPNSKNYQYYKVNINKAPESINYLVEMVKQYKPHTIINSIALAKIKEGQSLPKNYFNTNVNFIIYLLEALNFAKISTKFINFGSSEEIRCKLGHTIYGASKVAAQSVIRAFREEFSMDCIQLSPSNFESKYRQDHFLTTKVVKYVCDNIGNIKSGTVIESLKVGDIDVIKYWQHSFDVVRAILLLIEHDKNFTKDYLLVPKSGVSVREFISNVFNYCNIKTTWIKKDKKDILLDIKRNNILAETDKTLQRFGIDKGEDLLLNVDRSFNNDFNYDHIYNVNDIIEEMVDDQIIKKFTKV